MLAVAAKSMGLVSAVIIAVVLYSPVALSAVQKSVDDLVSTPSGLLRGLRLQSWTGKEFWSFRGVPFAEPPVGNLRFKPPVSKRPWEGVRNATRDGSVCIQPDGSDFFGSPDEDCLYLNVYTKNYSGNYPVIVFFHPGAFYSNTGASNVFGPQYLLDYDIVLVTVNYRLDALGFLSTGDKTSVGNYGMKDQVEALRWVKKHIFNFGGNPNKVTIAGYSAGSSSTFLHMMSPMSKGLFHNVIAMSGGLTSDWVVTKDPLTNAKRLAKLLNCSSDNPIQIVECFKKLPATEVNSKFSEQRVFDGLPMVRFGPVIEPDLGNGGERFLTEDPVSLIKKKQFNHVPVVTGVTEYEFIGWFQDVLNNDTLRKEFVNNFDTLAPQIFGYPDKKHDEAQFITNSLKEFYFKNKPITKNSLYEVGQLYSDFTIIYGEHTTTKLLVEYNDKPVYSYLLKYKGRYGHVKDNNNKTIGPSHHDDLLYLFYISIAFPEFKKSDPEAFMVKTETTFWKNFATNSDPTPDNLSFRWTPVTKFNKKYLNIDSQLSMKDVSESPFVERMKLWEKLFPVK